MLLARDALGLGHQERAVAVILLICVDCVFEIVMVFGGCVVG